MKNKILKIVLRVLLAIVLLIFTVLGVFSIGERFVFWNFYHNSERHEPIPGLWEGYIPQGYTVLDSSTRLSCGYMSNGEASRIYVTSGINDPVFVSMKKADGSNYTGHTGGISVYGDNVYITAKTGCDIFSLSDILDGDGSAIQKDSVATINDPAYCVINGNMLYVGSFYREGNYETPESHRLTTPAGDKNTAIISAYKLNSDTGKPYGSIPDYVYSTAGLAQGMTFTDDGRMIISTSYGFAKSHLFVYDIDKATVDNDGFDINGVKIPLIYLDSDCLTHDIVAPPMAEEIIYDSGIVYIMNESASMKYLFGKLTSGTHVYGYKLDQ
ncbi:MAG: hypothetical protein J6B72_05095 [Clostridia bacterium]|nr:hypothetical protein [Clostridia bacterium]